MKPLVFDLFCGLFGWGEAFSQHGYNVVGFDCEDQFKNCGKAMPENCELVLRDVRSITGAELVKQYGVPTIIVASPPCQEFSYMAMPWSKAKEKMRKILADPAEQTRLTDLFNQCFRIQREVSEAAGHYVPMILENVRGAQRWVGKARWNFGSFYLWGDVPALMPIPGRTRLEKGIKTDYREKRYGTSSWTTGHLTSSEGNKTVGMNRSNRDTYGNAPIAQFSSKSNARKRASAEIAKIPPSLAAWIAKTFKPCPSETNPTT